jgi:hypothetical protein
VGHPDATTIGRIFPYRVRVLVHSPSPSVCLCRFDAPPPTYYAWFPKDAVLLNEADDPNIDLL